MSGRGQVGGQVGVVIMLHERDCTASKSAFAAFLHLKIKR